jgi:hypothetical protein
MRLKLAGTLVAAAALAFPLSSEAQTVWQTLAQPIASGQLTQLPAGGSEYMQPWRSSLVTRPATALTGAIGINFNVTPTEAAATAQLLHASGFARVRLEVPWAAMSYTDPGQLASPSKLDLDMTAMRDNDLRPLILLNANSGMPGPSAGVTLDLTAAAPQGATTVSLSDASAAQVVPGLTGFYTPDGLAAGDLITSVTDSGVATLSRPLPMSLPAGDVGATTLRYGPFAPPTLADGSPNPRFQQTLAGWLTYVKGVCDAVRADYGSDDFDVEIWNELSFGSDFLDESNYYDPVPDPGATGSVDDAIVAATVAMLHDPANGLTDVRIGDGFTNQTGVPSGATVPAGVDAIDKHLYPGTPSYPDVGQVDMPEWSLTGLDGDTLMHDLSPFQTDVDGTVHGASTHPAGAAAPGVWITEANLDADRATSLGLPAADVPEFQAKTALRFYAAYAGEGVQAIDLYAATGGSDWQMIPQSFFDAVDADPTAAAPLALGGETMQAIGRMTATMAGARPIADPRRLTLTAVADDDPAGVQFTAPGGSLPNRDVLAFFPFQVSAHRFVAAVYVMTHDLTQRYTGSPAAGQTPYDLPAESFRVMIGNVDAADASVSLTDPLTGDSAPATIVSRSGSKILVQLAATDSPRMLTIVDGPAPSAVSARAGAHRHRRHRSHRRRTRRRAGGHRRSKVR